MAKKTSKSIRSSRTNKKVAVEVKPPKDKLLSKLTVFFFNKPLLTAFLWIVLTVFGALSYTTLMRREGFPSVNIPLVIVGGTYFVNDAERVDQEVAEPLSDIALAQEGVESVQTSSANNFFTVTIAYSENTESKAAAERLEQAVNDSGRLPSQVMAHYNVPYFGATGGDIEKIDLAISFYADNDVPLNELTDKATAAAAWLKEKNLSFVADVFVKEPFEETVNPLNGQAVTVQSNFDRLGLRTDGQTKYYESVIVGVSAASDIDVIKLDEQIRHALDELERDPQFEGFNTEITASFAPQIEENISELQRVLFEGLLAVLIVGSIVITLRASVITVVSMVTTIAIVLGFLHLIGYTLNVITLFALILALALMVDDTIIMVEAIDAARHHHKDKLKAVREATRKVSRAMVAATLTAALSFAPFLFVGGVLGEFIRAIPITVISALLISLLVALIFIPFFARQLLLGKKQMGKKGVVEVAEGIEARIANFLAWPMLWGRRSRRKLFMVGSIAVIFGFGFIMAGGLIFRNVVFNIFPPTKDTNGLVLSINFPPGLTIEQTEAVAAEADKLAAEVIGDNFVRSSYFGTGSQAQAMEQIEIISYSKRDIRSPEIVEQLQTKFDSEFEGAKVSVGQLDVGPPASSFIVQIAADNRAAAFAAAEDLAAFLEAKELERPNGSKAHFVNINVSSSDQYVRDDGRPVVTVSSGFDATDTSTLVTLGEQAVDEEFTPAKLAGYGLAEDAINLDLGQEEENQDSFRTLALAFPILLAVMYVLLAIQFRSLLQPLLIFMAIPFSFFGIALGLDLTNNAFSFFAMLGFFALLGLSIKNTILLTDFANQARRAGLGAVDSAVAALRERFRPLFATSVTAVVSLIPLAISSPFWEGLSVVLIFGLLSSTFLVLVVFPYYYLGAEFLREKIRARQFVLWLIMTAIAAVIAGRLWGLGVAMAVFPASLALVWLQKFYARRLA